MQTDITYTIRATGTHPEITLSASELYPIYKFVQKTYREKDAADHIDDWFEQNEDLPSELRSQFDETDYASLAGKFESAHDATVSENDMWEGLVEEYVQARLTLVCIRYIQEALTKPELTGTEHALLNEILGPRTNWILSWQLPAELKKTLCIDTPFWKLTEYYDRLTKKQDA